VSAKGRLAPLIPLTIETQEFCEALGPNKSATVIKDHWQTWVQQSDIQALAAANVTHLYDEPKGQLHLPLATGLFRQCSVTFDNDCVCAPCA
jgi:hypothetical protein